MSDLYVRAKQILCSRYVRGLYEVLVKVTKASQTQFQKIQKRLEKADARGWEKDWTAMTKSQNLS